MAVIAHHKELSRRNNEVPVHDMAGELIGPCVGNAGVRVAIAHRRNGRKLIIKGPVVRWRCGLGMRLHLLFAVDVDDAIVKMNMVSGRLRDA